MLLEELSRNKKAGFIIVALCVIYIISKNFLFRTILGRLLLVIGLVVTTKCNKALGLGLVILICLAYSQMSNDFENMENPELSKASDSSKAPKVTAPNTADVEDKKRIMSAGKKVSSLPIPPKVISTEDVPGTSKESFLNFSPYSY